MKTHLKIDFDLQIKKKEEFKTMLSFLKKEKKSFLIWFISLLLALICYSINDINSKESAFENFYTLVTKVSKDSQYNHNNFTIFPTEERDSFTTLRQFFNENEFTYSSSKTSCMNYLSINSNIKPFFKVTFDEQLNYEPISVISPKTMSIKERNDVFSMSSLRVQTYYPAKNDKEVLFCYISDIYAQTLMKEMHLEEQSELLGKYLYLSYKIDSVQKNEKLMITNIYYACEQDASYYSSVYGNFIITYLLNHRNIKGMGLSIDLSRSLAQNKHVFSSVEKMIIDDNMGFTFASEYKKGERTNRALIKAYTSYLCFKEGKSNFQKNFFFSMMLICYSFSLFEAVRLFDKFAKKNESNSKFFYSCFFAILFCIYVLLYGTYKVILSKYFMISSTIFSNWFLMLCTLYIVILVISMINKRVRGKKDAIKEKNCSNM